METVEKIKQQIAENPIILYMKGSPKLPSCGFSSQVAQIMINIGEQFSTDIRMLQNINKRELLADI
ncbi:glutaredoxin family protein, partial [Shewanella chilikensis]|nr:glutaredoxin [Shewanella chilikensis]